MKLADYPAAFIEALCVHEALGRLGFSMDAVHFMPAGALDPSFKRMECAVVLRDQCRQLVVTVGGVDKSESAIAAAWVEFATRASRGEFAGDFQAAFASSSVARNAPAFIFAILQKGFTIPREPSSPAR